MTQFQTKEGSRGDMRTWILEDTEARSRVELVPERGALVTSFQVEGDELLYLDEATLLDRTQNVRGGIPVLFPCAGALPEGRYTWDDVTYELPKHGFARKMGWSSQDFTDDRAARVRCQLRASAETRRVFPFDFEARLTFSLVGAELLLDFVLQNRDTKLLPLHLGFHPYFSVPGSNKGAARVETNATRAYDNRTGATGPVQDFDFTQDELDQHLLDHGMPGTRLQRGPGQKPIRLEYSADFRCLVLWTLGGRDFICVEPWTAAGGALASKEGLLSVAPGEAKRLTFRISRGE